MKNIIKNITINIVVLVTLWCLLELICYKIYQNIPVGYRNGKRIVELNLGHKIDNSDQSIISHPYLLYVNNPNYFDSVQQNNSFGYRGPEFSFVKDPNTIRVLTLGGSTTYGFLNKNPRTTWPALLQEKLQKISSKKVEVINGGLNYATSAELLASYVFRHRYLHADIIIFHEGGNDVAAEIFPNYNPEYSHFRSNGSNTKLRDYESFFLHSNVFKLIYSIWLYNMGTVYSSQPYSFSLLNKDEVSKRVLNDSNYTGFKRNVDLLVKLAKMDSSKIFLMGFLSAPKEQICLARPDIQNIVDETIYACNKNNDIMKTICLTQNINYINLNPQLFKKEWFIDNAHLRPQGEEMKAQIVFDELKGLFK